MPRGAARCRLAGRPGAPRTQARRRAASHRTTPAATPAFSDSAPPGIGIRTRRSQVSPTSRDRPLPSLPTTMTTGPSSASTSCSSSLAVGGQTDDRQTGLLVRLQGAGQVGGAGDRRTGRGARRGLPRTGRHSGGPALGHDHAVAAEGARRSGRRRRGCAGR